MTVVETKISDDIMSLTKRIYRKNTKDQLSYNMSKIVKIAQRCEDEATSKELWDILHNILW